jgi:hypothetical protein
LLWGESRCGCRCERASRSRWRANIAARVNEKRTDLDTGERKRFSSAIPPPWARKTRKVTGVLPLLFLHGLSSRDFVPALGQFLGSGRGALCRGEHQAHRVVEDRTTRLLPTWPWQRLRPGETPSMRGSTARAVAAIGIIRHTSMRRARDKGIRRPSHRAGPGRAG